MKLLSYRTPETLSRLGFLYDSDIYDLERSMQYFSETSSALPPTSMLEVLNMDGEMFHLVSKTYRMISSLSDSREKLSKSGICQRAEKKNILLPFVPRAVICTGNNYSDHLREKEVKDSKDEKGEDIEFFPKLQECMVGPYDPITHSPELTEKLDYEIELAVVIGRKGRNLSLDEAKKCIFGYTVINDLCARDRQMTAEGCQKLGLSKNFDGCGAIGPCIVSADEFEDPPQLEMITKVNDEIRQHSNTKYMINKPAFLISYFSKFFELKPGYLLATGTIGGTAWSTDVSLGGVPYERSDIVRGGYLKPGDKVICSIEGIGELCNPII